MQPPLVMKLIRNRRYNNKGCWLWSGFIANNGYGRVKNNNEDIHIHTLSAKLYNIFEEGLQTLHRCNIRRCFNPGHLYAGTQKDNVRDQIKDGTHPSNSEKLKTHCPHGHEYTIVNTRICRDGSRKCKICEFISNNFRNIR